MNDDTSTKSNDREREPKLKSLQAIKETWVEKIEQKENKRFLILDQLRILRFHSLSYSNHLTREFGNALLDL